MPHYTILKCETEAKIKQGKKHLFTHYVEGTGYRVQGKVDLIDIAKMIHDEYFLEWKMARSFQYFFVGII